MQLSDSEYGKVLDNIVVGCVDVAVIYQGKILLERRGNHPIKNQWWIFGGRILKGEDFQLTAQRGVHRELNLRVKDKQRFKQIGVFNLIWPTRREPKQENGCHHLLVAHSLSVTDTEFKELNAFINNNKMYAWFDLNENNKLFLPELNDIISKVKSGVKEPNQ